MAIILKKFTVTLIIVVSCLACDQGTKSPTQLKNPPTELLGIWMTDAPAYKDRYLIFEKNYVLFGIGNDKSPTMQHIVKLDAQPDGGQTSYTIYSKDNDGTHELRFTYNPADGGTLSIKNQIDVLWKKVE